MDYQPIYNNYASTENHTIISDYDSELGISLSEPSDSPSDNFLSSLMGGQLRYDFLSADTLRQMINEREGLKNKNRSSILGQLSDLSSDISVCENRSGPYSIDKDADKKLIQLQKTKLDLERQLLSEDVECWRDTFMLRRDLVAADRQYSSTKLRTGLFAANDNYDTKQSTSSVGAGYMPGITSDYRKYSG